MNKEQLQKDLQEVLQKHGLNIQYMNIDHERIANDFYTINKNIWDSGECWFEDLQVNKIGWLLSMYGKDDLQLDFDIESYELIQNAVKTVLDNNKLFDIDIESKTLGQIKEDVSDDIFNNILEVIIEYISEEDYFSNIEENLKDWFGIEYPDEEFNEMEALAYWTVYFQPRIENEELAWKLGLVPFFFEDEFYLALGGCGMDLSPKLDAYQALTDDTVPSDSRFRNERDQEYAKYVVGEETYNKVIEVIKCDPKLHIQTEKITTKQEVTHE